MIVKTKILAYIAWPYDAVLGLATTALKQRHFMVCLKNQPGHKGDPRVLKRVGKFYIGPSAFKRCPI